MFVVAVLRSVAPSVGVNKWVHVTVSFIFRNVAHKCKLFSKPCFIRRNTLKQRFLTGTLPVCVSFKNEFLLFQTFNNRARNGC